MDQQHPSPIKIRESFADRLVIELDPRLIADPAGGRPAAGQVPWKAVVEALREALAAAAEGDLAPGWDDDMLDSGLVATQPPVDAGPPTVFGMTPEEARFKADAAEIWVAEVRKRIPAVERLRAIHEGPLGAVSQEE